MHYNAKNIVQLLVLLIISRPFWYCYHIIIAMYLFLLDFLLLTVCFSVISPTPYGLIVWLGNLVNLPEEVLVPIANSAWRSLV